MTLDRLIAALQAVRTPETGECRVTIGHQDLHTHVTPFAVHPPIARDPTIYIETEAA